MSFPRFFVGMAGVLVVFAIVTYLGTHSIWTTFVQTLICAVLIQLGYFGAIFWMVHQARRRAPPADLAARAVERDQASERVPGRPAVVPRIGHPRKL